MSHSPARPPLGVVCALACALFGLSAHTHAQAVATSYNSDSRSASVVTNDAGPAGIIPATRGFNASLGTTSQHDSSNGWSTLLTPGIAYRFNSLLSFNASIPLYTSIDVETNTGTKSKPVYVSTTRHGLPGDASLTVVLDTHPGPFDYAASVSVGLPSGNTAYGLGSGKPTYDLNNHFETSFGIFSPNIEVGFANSSNLIATRARKGYTAQGNLLHLQAGASIELPFNSSLETDAYEDMPISASTIYSTTNKGKKKTTTASSSSAAEDNGINTSLDVPFGRHLTFSGFYNHSTRSQDDIAGISLTFLLKPSPQPEAR